MITFRRTKRLKNVSVKARIEPLDERIKGCCAVGRLDAIKLKGQLVTSFLVIWQMVFLH